MEHGAALHVQGQAGQCLQQSLLHGWREAVRAVAERKVPQPRHACQDLVHIRLSQDQAAVF